MKMGENKKNVFHYNCLSLLGDYVIPSRVTNLADLLNERQVNMYYLYIWYNLQLHVKTDKEISLSVDRPCSTLTSLVWL